MKKIFTLIFLASIAFQSCKKEEEFCFECTEKVQMVHTHWYNDPEIVCGMTMEQASEYQRLKRRVETDASGEVIYTTNCKRKD